jgi:hypothetical protein
MAFWSDTGQGVPAPKRNYRWLLFLGGIPQWICKKVTKPSFSLSEAEHTYLNHKFYYPGRVEWTTVDVTLVDPVSPDASQTMYDIFKSAGYTPPENQIDTMTVSKAAAVNSLGTVRIQQLGVNTGTSGTNVAAEGGIPTLPVEEWILYNAWVKEVKFGELDYTSDDLTEITLTLRYDFAKLNKDNKASANLDPAAGKGVDPANPDSGAPAGPPLL